MRAWTLTIMTLIAGLSGCANIGDFDEVAPPTWEAGYAFAYDIRGEVQASGFAQYNGDRQELPPEVETLPRTPFLTYEVLGTRFHDGGEPIYVTAAQFFGEDVDLMGSDGSLDGMMGLAARHRDLMMAPLDGYDGCDPCEMPADKPGDIYLDFPLTPGKQWSHKETADGVVMKTDSQAVDMLTIDLESGPAQAVKIVTDVTYNIDDATRKEAAAQGADIDLSGGGTITTYYAPAVLNVVRERYQLDLHLEAAFDGARSEMDVRLDLTTDLIGAILDPSGERSKAEIQAFLANNQQVRDPTGALEVPLGDYTISIEGDSFRANGADAETLTFDVVADTEIPADHQVAFEVIDAMGNSIASGTETPFEVTFEGAGVHAIRATTSHDGQLMAKATRAVFVDYQGSIPVSCGPVTVNALAMTACDSTTIPVAPGASSIGIRVEAARPVPGDLRVTDGFGTTESYQTMDGQASADDLGGLIADGAWTIQWRPTVSVADGGSYHIDLQYGPATSADAGEDTLAALPFAGLLQELLADEPLWALF